MKKPVNVPLVLAVEPDLRQGALLKRVIGDGVHAELILVDSRDAAIAALSARVPDVILLTALLSPRDEAEMVAHLRTLEGAEHVQTHTIPQLASGSSGRAEPPASSGRLLGKFRRKKEAPELIEGCDPALFADEIRAFLARAAELKAHAAAAPQSPEGVRKSSRKRRAALDEGADTPPPDADAAGAEAAAGSAWSSPFEWRKANPINEPALKTTRPALVTSAPLAVIAEEQDQRRGARDAETERARAAADRAAADRAAAEAKAAAEAAAKREQERKHLEAEAAAKREQERQRLEAEAAKREQERQRLEAEAAVKREVERQRLEAEAAVKREAERQRLEAEAAVKREAERKRLEAEAAVKREAERKRLEAEAAVEREAECKRLEAEAAIRREQERKHLEAEAAAKREQERKRLEAEAAATREKVRLATELAAGRETERLRVEAEAVAQRQRLETEAAHRRDEQDRIAREQADRAAADRAAAADLEPEPDAFADFREDAPSILGLMPLSLWARREESDAPAPARHADELRELIEALALPPHVAGVSYARGCRIRRVRVAASGAPARAKGPVIVSKRALDEIRAGN